MVSFKKDAIVIIYGGLKDGEILEIPKERGLNYHIQYLNKEQSENYFLRKEIENINLEEILENPAQIGTLIDEIARKGHIILMNYSCNYYGETNCFSAFFPEKPSQLQKQTINQIQKELSELEFYLIGKYNSEFNRVKTLEITDINDDVLKR